MRVFLVLSKTVPLDARTACPGLCEREGSIKKNEESPGVERKSAMWIGVVMVRVGAGWADEDE